MKCFCEDLSNMTAFSINHYEKIYKINFKTLKQFEKLDLLTCKDCDTQWLLDKTSENNYAVRMHSPYQYTLLDEWLKHERSAKRFKKIINIIGYTNENDIVVPCKVTLKGAKQIDFCVLYKTSCHPKISRANFTIKNIIYTDDIDILEESKYALSFEHRLAIINAREIYNLYAPMNLMINDEIYFRYQAYNNKFLNLFFKYKDYDASSIVSTNQDIKKYNKPIDNEDLNNKLTLILCDEI